MKTYTFVVEVAAEGLRSRDAQLALEQWLNGWDVEVVTIGRIDAPLKFVGRAVQLVKDLAHGWRNGKQSTAAGLADELVSDHGVKL